MDRKSFVKKTADSAAECNFANKKKCSSDRNSSHHCIGLIAGKKYFVIASISMLRDSIFRRNEVCILYYYIYERFVGRAPYIFRASSRWMKHRVFS